MFLRRIGEIQKDGTTVFTVEQNAYTALRMAYAGLCHGDAGA